MEEINVITSVSQKDGKYGIALGKDNWFNGDGTCLAKKGDKVKVTFEVNGTWKNLSKIEVVEEAKVVENASEVNGRLRRITDCVLAADEDFRNDKIPKSEIFEHAKTLYNAVLEIGKL